MGACAYYNWKLLVHELCLNIVFLHIQENTTLIICRVFLQKTDRNGEISQVLFTVCRKLEIERHFLIQN